MQIRPTNHIQTSQPINLTTRNVAERTSSTLPVDQLEISTEARLMETQAAGSSARADRIAEIRAQISQGQYDTAEKLEIAVSRLFDEIA
jgi:negative regulator of flagellin synthesis FlgM